MKCAAYCLTRNIYHKVIPSLKSLLMHSDVDKVYLVIEDDDIGFSLPDKVQCVNAVNQPYFARNGPNYNCGWTYMVMMRVVMCKLFPDLHRILTLDADTIIREDISTLWELPIDDKYLAAAKEPERSRTERADYHNMGVALWNLDKMRNEIVDRIIYALNTKRYPFVEQDCVNELCRGAIYSMPPEYNANRYTSMDKGIRIRHYAAEGNWFARPEVQYYFRIPWEECVYKSERR